MSARKSTSSREEDGPSPLSAGTAPGARHPRETLEVLGQSPAERRFMSAREGGRLHHAWALTGAPGVGKATLAYRLARAMLSPSGDGDLGREEALLQSGAHPGLFELRPAWDEKKGRPKGSAGVDEARRLQRYFSMRRPDGGWRIAIVDAADDLTREAANALLKTLEEPPERALFLLVCHAPGRLPPTVLSRCVTVALRSLSPEETAAAVAAAAPSIEPEDVARLGLLAGGSPGEAARLQAFGGWSRYADALALLESAPRVDPGRAAAFAQRAPGASAAEALEPAARLLTLALERIARAGASGDVETSARLAPAEARLAAQVAPNARAAAPWAEAALGVRAKLETAQALNLDPARSMIDIAHYLSEQARKALAAS